MLHDYDEKEESIFTSSYVFCGEKILLYRYHVVKTQREFKILETKRYFWQKSMDMCEIKLGFAVYV